MATRPASRPNWWRRPTEAGGKDNITALFVAGPKFRGRGGATRPRLATTRQRRAHRPVLERRLAFLTYGVLIGMLLWAVLRIMTAPARLGRYEIVRQIGRSMTDVYLAIDTVENRKAALKLIPPGAMRIRGWCWKPNAAAPPFSGNCAGSIRAWWRSTRPATWTATSSSPCNMWRAATWPRCCSAERTIDSHPRRRHRARNLRAAHQVPHLAIGGGARRYQAFQHPSGTQRHRAAARFRHRQDAARDCDATVAHFGSPSYCSPERLTRSEVDQQSDLWAVGATLYEMLAGSPPYQAEDTRKLESLIRSRRPPRALPSQLSRGAAGDRDEGAGARCGAAVPIGAAISRRICRRFWRTSRCRRNWSARHGSASATIEAAREFCAVTRTVLKLQRRLRVLGGAGWFLLGMALWIGGTLVWRASREPVAVDRSRRPAPGSRPASRRLPASLR